MTDFIDQDLRGSRFEQTDLSGSRFRFVDLHDVVMDGVELLNVEIIGELENVSVNGVDIGPLVEAELDRRDPDRVKMRPTDAVGFREGWDVVERLWAGTVARAAALDPALLHESVQGEWTFIETLRHLVFASESWVGRVILGQSFPWHAWSLPWDQMADTPGVPRDRTIRPSLAEVLSLRQERMAMVRGVVDGLTETSLDEVRTTPEGPGWPPAGRQHSVRECLRIVLNEEYEHRRFAERDLDVLTGVSAESAPAS